MPVSGSNGYRSGIVTLPNRVRIREMDSRLGMYPTISRTGDATRGGNLNIPEFDDTQTIVFKEGVSNLLLGTLLESGSVRSLLPYAGNNNPNGGITGTGNVISGISDNFYMTDYKEHSSKINDTASSVENLGFFDDSRLSLSDSVFYMTGTSETVYPGFDSRLHDKTQIVIDMSSVERTQIGNINRANNTDYDDDTSNVRQPYMAYYNRDLKRWERLGKGYGKNQTNKNESTFKDIITKTHLGFSGLPAKGAIATGSAMGGSDFTMLSEDMLNSSMRPISTFGFPFDGRYHATGSQTIDMKDYIDAPFVVEKVVFDFDAEIETSDDHNRGYKVKRAYPSGGAPSAQGELSADVMNHNFFLLRQFKNNFTTSWNVITGSQPVLGADGYGINVMSSSIPGYYYLSEDENLTLVEDEREMITYGQLIDTWIEDDPHDYIFSPKGSGITRDQILSSSIIAGRDSVNLRVNPMTYPSANRDVHITGSFSVPCTSRHTGQIGPVNAALIYTGSGTTSFLWFENQFSSRGRDSLDKSRRALVNGHQSLVKGNNVLVNALKAADQPFPLSPSKSESLEDHSPYILFPEDKIIIGYQYPIGYDLGGIAGYGPDSNDDSKFKFSFFGKGKITIFGSLIKNNKEFHDTLNQPLTSEAVHEAIHYDNPVLDQYLIATRNEYAGSYVDSHSTGSIGSTVRSLIGTGENILSGSLQRFVNIRNPLLRYYDTVLPDITEMVRIDGFEPLKGVSLGVKDAEWFLASFLSSAGGNHIHTFWNKIFPFESRYNAVNRQIDQSFYLYQITSQNSATLSLETRSNASFIGTDKPTSIGDIDIIFENSTFIAFTFGEGPENLHRHIDSSTRFHRPSGCKYGIMNTLPQFSKNVFRYDKFGQYADMLEQGTESRFFIGQGGITQGALTIRFVSDDDKNDQYIELNEDQIVSNTFESSNLSLYATSSLPFFDDDTPRNRNYNNIFFSNAVIDIVGFGV
jgi:hypothetical protein